MVGLEMATQLASALANNKYASGIIAIVLNVGTSYLLADLMPLANRLFQHRWARRIVFFVIFFTTTRDVVTSVIMTLVCTLLLDYFLNENSTYCMIPFSCRNLSSDPPRREGFRPTTSSSASSLSRLQRAVLNAQRLHRPRR